jgi:trigger factor
LKIETQTIENHQAKLTVEIDPAPLEDAKHRAASKLSKRSKIPGFRPGKAPYAMVVRHLGEATILEEAMDILIDEIYPKVIEESGIKPYGPGTLQEIKSLEPPTFEFVVPLAATVELGDYHTIREPYELKEITEDEVEGVLTNLRNNQAIIEPIDRPAQEGDQVNIHLSAQRLHVKEGEIPTLMRERAVQVVIEADGDDSIQNLPFEGFSQHLIGLKAGETHTFQYTYPEDSAAESLRGVEAEFNVSVDQVNTRTLPEINDELAQSVGDYASLEELRKAIRNELEEHARSDYNADYDDKVMEKLIEISKIEYPPQMLEREIEIVIERLKNRLAEQNLDINLYLKTRGIDLDALKEESKPVAISRLKKSLVIFEVADKEKIEVDQDQLQNETIRTMDLYSRILPQKEFRKLTAQGGTTNLVGNIMMDLVADKTLEYLRNIARGLEAEAKRTEAEPAPGAQEPIGEGGSNLTVQDEAPLEPVIENAQAEAPTAKTKKSSKSKKRSTPSAIAGEQTND